MIPSGYKEDVVYSQIPTSGAGDLSFTRASNGTRINSAGLVEVTPWNLLSDTDTFSSWNLEGGTLTSGQTDPNGGSTAYKYVQVPGGGLYSGSGGVTADVKCAQVWIKSVSGGSITCNIGDGAAGFGTLNVTGTWQLFTAPYTVNSRIAIYLYSISNASGIYVWHPQVNIGSTAKPYFPTTDRLNVPRLTYQNGGGGCPSLLLEKQSTNLATYSEQFDNASWSKTAVTLTANATNSPDGTTNATSIIPTTANVNNHRVFETNSHSVATASYSIFVKPNGYYRVALRESGTTGAAIGFDLLNETIITTFSTGGCTTSGGKIENMGNGWYRVSGVFSFASATAQNLGLYIVSSSWTSGDPESVAWAGNGTSGVYLYGAQFEASSYPTTYIPTTSSSATRVADACSKTGISSLIGQTEGTMFVDVDFTHIVSANNEYLAQILQDSSNRILLYRSSASSEIGVVVLRSGGSVFTNVSSVSTNTRHKIAIAYKSGDLAFYIDGVQIATNTTTFSAFSSLSEFDLGNNNTSGTPAELGDYEYNEAILFPTRLTNAELASLTTI